MVWKPNVTVASVIEQDGKFLLVEEQTDDGIQFNQPAGHLEADESLSQAAVRETLEETAYHFHPEWLVGVYHWRHPSRDITYLRFAFGGTVIGHDATLPLDSGIIRAVWLDLEEIRATVDRHRSPLVLQCVLDYVAEKRFSLDLITHYE